MPNKVRAKVDATHQRVLDNTNEFRHRSVSLSEKILYSVKNIYSLCKSTALEQLQGAQVDDS